MVRDFTCLSRYPDSVPRPGDQHGRFACCAGLAN
jgi:hypothetical protein